LESRRDMTTLEKTQTLPLRLTEDGTIRVADSRVSLDSVVQHYKLGASAEQIVQKFPALELADVYAAISYYLNHEETVEEYLRQQEAEGDEVQKGIESDPQQQKNSTELRARLLARKSELKKA
jgi:uncharacterized protein (DUF433 family)